MGRVDEPVLLFSVHVQPDFLLPIWDCDIAFRSRDNDRFAGGGWAELLRKIHLDC